MGEVYRVRDTRLDRDVAIKIPPESLRFIVNLFVKPEHPSALTIILNATSTQHQ